MWPPVAASPPTDMAATRPAGPRPASPRPLVEVLTFQGCPHREAAIALVERVGKQLANNAEVRVIEVPDQHAAEQIRFLGSPSIRVDGHDIEPGADRRQEFVHACRLYRGQHSLHGLPEDDWLRQALRTAEAGP
jgi:hypothetical protein